MDFITEFKTEFHKLIFQKGRGKNANASVYDCAEEVGLTYNILWKYGSINHQVMPPMQVVSKLMKYKGNYGCLKVFNKHHNCLTILYPKTKIKTGDEKDIVLDYHDVSAEVERSLRCYFDVPNEDNYKKCSDALHKILEESAAIKKYVEKKNSRQEEMF